MGAQLAEASCVPCRKSRPCRAILDQGLFIKHSGLKPWTPTLNDAPAQCCVGLPLPTPPRNRLEISSPRKCQNVHSLWSKRSELITRAFSEHPFLFFLCEWSFVFPGLYLCWGDVVWLLLDYSLREFRVKVVTVWCVTNIIITMWSQWNLLISILLLTFLFFNVSYIITIFSLTDDCQ